MINNIYLNELLQQCKNYLEMGLYSSTQIYLDTYSRVFFIVGSISYRTIMRTHAYRWAFCAQRIIAHFSLPPVKLGFQEGRSTLYIYIRYLAAQFRTNSVILLMN